MPAVAWALTDETGRFRLENVPAGRHALKVWHEKTGEKELEVDVRGGAETPLDATLDGSRYREAPHKNKNGEEYPKSERGDERY